MSNPHRSRFARRSGSKPELRRALTPLVEKYGFEYVAAYAIAIRPGDRSECATTMLQLVRTHTEQSIIKTIAEIDSEHRLRRLMTPRLHPLR